MSLSLRLNYGDVKSLMGKRSEAELAGSMLMRGSAKHSRQQIEDTLDILSTSLDMDGGATSLQASGRTVRKNLAPVIDLLAEILRKPTFPAAELETLKRESIASLEQERADPEAMANRTLARYGNPYPRGDVRYEPTLDEEIAETKTPGVAALKAFHQQFYGGAAGEIAIVGDFDAAAVKAQLEKSFGDWKAVKPFARVPDPLVVKKPVATKIETPDKANAYIVGATSFPLMDTDPDYPALMLANYIVGGSADSRLWNRIRQREGLSYGVGSSLSVSRFEPNASFNVSATFAPQVLDRLRNGLQEELSRATSAGFTSQEVSEAKSALLLERGLSRTRDPSLAGALVEQEYVGRTFALSGQIDKAIEALTPEQVSAALKKYVNADALAYVFAGDFAKARK